MQSGLDNDNTCRGEGKGRGDWEEGKGKAGWEEGKALGDDIGAVFAPLDRLPWQLRGRLHARRQGGLRGPRQAGGRAAISAAPSNRHRRTLGVSCNSLINSLISIV